MKRLSICLIAGLFCAAGAAAPAQCSDPGASLAQFSDFPKIDVRKLMKGEILGKRGQLMDFPNGITSQTCFYVPTPPEETARRLKTWDPTRCDSVKVYRASKLKSPCSTADFSGIDFMSNEYPVRWLLDATTATTAGKSALNLTRVETQELAGCAGKPASPQTVGSCWSKLLFERASAFQNRGFGGTLPYETGKETVSPLAMIRSMLQERARISHEFAPILGKTGMLDDSSTMSALTPYHYWSFFDANHHGTFSLGAVYELAVADRYQLLDITYYVSGTFYTSATLFEIWPISDGGKTGSLVWRGDFFASHVLRFTKGIERIATGALMIQELKKEIRCFQDSVGRYP
jgi:hypothetical protein